MLVGKSRLIYEFEAWLDSYPVEPIFSKGAPMKRLPACLTVYCVISSATLQIMDSDSQSEAREKLMKGIATLTRSEIDEQAAFIGELLGFNFSDSMYVRGIQKDARQIRGRSFGNIARFFERITRDFVTVLLLDDIHWSDNGSLALIEHLAKVESDLPLFILCAARPSLDETRPNWGHDFPRCNIITIKTLDLQSSRELVNEILQNVPRTSRRTGGDSREKRGGQSFLS